MTGSAGGGQPNVLSVNLGKARPSLVLHRKTAY